MNNSRSSRRSFSGHRGGSTISCKYLYKVHREGSTAEQPYRLIALFAYSHHNKWLWKVLALSLCFEYRGPVHLSSRPPPVWLRYNLQVRNPQAHKCEGSILWFARSLTWLWISGGEIGTSRNDKPDEQRCAGREYPRFTNLLRLTTNIWIRRRRGRHNWEESRELQEDF